MTELSADAVVVGSGAGGAAVAAELAEAGLDVVVLEEGVRHDHRTFTARPRDMTRACTATPASSPPRHAADRAAARARRRRHDADQLRHLLPHARRACSSAGRASTASTALDAAACFDRVEDVIGVAEVPAALAGRNALLVARRGAEALGLVGGFLRRNARGCRGSGVCAFGCPTGAKQHAAAS